MKSLQLVRYLLACSWLFLSLLHGGATTEPVDEDARHVTYDQRQTGKYNIHVSIKDVAIIEMDQNEIEDESYGEEEYYYDESDLTVKPITLSSTTAAALNLTKPSKTTTEAITTAAKFSTSSTNNYYTEPLATNQHNSTFSPNLLSDLASAQASSSSSSKYSTATGFPTKPTTNVVILPASPTPAPTATSSPSELVARSKHIPVYANAVPPAILHPRHPQLERFYQPLPLTLQQQAPAQPYAPPEEPQRPIEARIANEDSKIYKFKVRSAKKPTAAGLAPPHGFLRRCRSNQYRDMNGNCRIKRSSSILKKLFSMLVSLPFANEKRSHDSE